MFSRTPSLTQKTQRERRVCCRVIDVQLHYWVQSAPNWCGKTCSNILFGDFNSNLCVNYSLGENRSQIPQNLRFQTPRGNNTQRKFGFF